MKALWPGGGSVPDVFGIITAPNHKGIPCEITRGKFWAGDVGALMGPDFVKKIDVNALAEWLPTMLPYASKCLFLAGADIVGDARGTLETYGEFKHYFEGWPLAYVAQNGAEDLPIPEDCAAVFVGGVPMLDKPKRTSRFYWYIKSGGIVKPENLKPDDFRHFYDWKESTGAVSVIKRAQAMGKHVHVGRVNSLRRYNLFESLAGSEHFTYDGTKVRYEGRERTLEIYENWENQQQLFLGL